MGVIKKLKGKEFVGWQQDGNTDVYPVTSTQAVFDKNNQNLDTIISGLQSQINSSGGSSTTTDSYEPLFAWSYAKDDASAIQKLTQSERAYPPAGWYSTTNFTIPEGNFLYMTTAKKKNGEFEQQSEDGKYVIWTKPIRLGSNTTSNTGADGNGYNYAYCRRKVDTAPPFNSSIITVSSIESARQQGGGISFSGELSTAQYDVWYDHPMGVTSEFITEWIVVFKGNDNSGWNLITQSPILWSKWGKNGMDGDGIEYVFCTPEKGDIPSNWGTSIKGRIGETGTTEYTIAVSNVKYDQNYQQDDFIPTGWHDEPQTLDQSHTEQYVCMRKRTWNTNDQASSWGMFSNPKLWSSIPQVIATEDLIDWDWSNNNVNIAVGEEGDELRKDTLNELRVTMGSDEIPYGKDNADDQGRYYLVEKNSGNTTVGEIAISTNTNGRAQVYVTELSYNKTAYTVGVKVTICYDGTHTTVINAAYAINVRQVAYDIVTNPSGYVAAITDVNLDSALQIQIRRKAVSEDTSYITKEALQEILGSKGSFYYSINGGANHIIMDANGNLSPSISYSVSGTNKGGIWTLQLADKASELYLTSSSRVIDIQLYSDNGYEDNEAIHIARDGEPGDEGPGAEYIFYRSQNDISSFELDSNNPNYEYGTDKFQQDNYVPSDKGWSDDIQNVDEQYQVQYIATRKKKDGVWSRFGTPKVWNRYVPSNYSLTLSNDSCIMDDQANTFTTQNVSFCRLQVWKGDVDITGNIDDYIIDIQVKDQNNLRDNAAYVYKASDAQLASILAGGTINGLEANQAAILGTDINRPTANGIAFFIYNKEADSMLPIGNYGLQYIVSIYENNNGSKGNLITSNLYKVQSIIVKNINATGTSYKLEITNDTWHYLGDSPYHKVSDQQDSVITVVRYTGNDVSNASFILSNSTPTSGNGLTVYIPEELETITQAQEVISHNITPKDNYSIPVHNIKLYSGTVLVDSENIDCERDGATGPINSGDTNPIVSSGSFVIDTQNLDVKFDYSVNSSTQIAKAVIIMYNLYKGQDWSETFNINSTTFSFKGELGKQFATATASQKYGSTGSTSRGLENTNYYNAGDTQQFSIQYNNQYINWITCDRIKVELYNSSNKLIYSTTIYRTGLDGYYWSADSNGMISIQSTGESISSIVQTSQNLSLYVKKGEKVGGVLIDENGSTFEGQIKADQYVQGYQEITSDIVLDKDDLKSFYLIDYDDIEVNTIIRITLPSTATVGTIVKFYPLVYNTQFGSRDQIELFTASRAVVLKCASPIYIHPNVDARSNTTNRPTALYYPGVYLTTATSIRFLVDVVYELIYTSKGWVLLNGAIVTGDMIGLYATNINIDS